MYAVIKTGGKQYRIKEGDIIKVEKLDKEPGEEVFFEDVLMLMADRPMVGAPRLANVTVKGTVIGQEKGKKIIVFKKRRRKGYHKKQGHRQLYTRCRIDEISIRSAEDGA